MPEPKFTFHVRMPQPATHYFEIAFHIENIEDKFINLAMPVWTPGSYLVREYSKNVEAVAAKTNSGEEIPVTKTAKNKWRIKGGKNIIVSYRVYAFEESVRTCLLDVDHASIAPAGLFMYPEDYDFPFTIHFHPPAEWKEISTALETVDGDKWKRIAGDKDTLYDSPVEIGNQKIITFSAAQVNHSIAIYGEGNYQTEKFLPDFSKIVEEEVKIFGHHPCSNYLFILLNSNSLRGGLEHLFSTSLIFKRFQYQPENNYLEFLSLVAHEYFHLWNVKRLRPAALGPFKYDQENYTSSLWIAEGFTSYYDDLILRRCNFYSERAYLDVLEKNMNDTLNPPGNFVQTVGEASFDAWIKYYRQNENSPNAQVNYYVKGSVLAMILDILIIHHSNGNHSLDNVMREAYSEFYLKQNKGYTEDEFKSILEKYCGQNIDWFYKDHVFGTKQPEVEKYLGLMGVEVKNVNENTIEQDLGIVINNKNIISLIRKNSAGEKAGLNVNDEIIAINGFRFYENFLPTIMTGKKTGDQFRITLNRNGMIRELQLSIQQTDVVQMKLNPAKEITDQQKMNYRRWLSI